MNEKKKKWALPVILIILAVVLFFVLSEPIRDLIAGGLGLFGLGFGTRNVVGRTAQLDDDIRSQFDESSDAVERLRKIRDRKRRNASKRNRSIRKIFADIKGAINRARERVQNRRGNKGAH